MSERPGAHARSRYEALAAAVLAVLAAIANLVAGQTATAALTFKSEAILAQTRASSAYSAYEAREIKEQVLAARLDSAGTLEAKARETLAAAIEREHRNVEPLLARAHESENEVETDNTKSERLAHAREIAESGVAFLEIAIALVSIAALLDSMILVGIASLTALGGTVLTIVAFVSRNG